MKRLISISITVFLAVAFTGNIRAQNSNLKLVFIRHAERPNDGDNLSCQGYNRSILLPAVLYKKFGRPGNIYIPALKTGRVTKRGRMFQTIAPFAIKYNLAINSEYQEEDYQHVGNALYNESGTVIIVWEHKAIGPIIKYLGIRNHSIHWPDNEFDAIWIVTFVKGAPVLTMDKEGLLPADKCNF